MVYFSQEANLNYHGKVCGEEQQFCQKSYAKSYVARHKRACRAAQGGDMEMEVAQPRARVHRRIRKSCPAYGLAMNASDIAPQSEACQGGGAYS